MVSDDPRLASRPTAASVLRTLRREIRTTVAEWTGAHSYTIDQVVQERIDRCRTLKLRLAIPTSRVRTQVTLLITVHTMTCLYVGRHEIAL